ncbi:hypothetical protein B566_EDAN012378 [Ephemera danica]|nr:hypothetical protein B566_EDAN012378 [Ephemera danica]
MLQQRPKIVVTGFGPFGKHKINASWEAVKLLPSLNLEEELDLELIIQEIPVQYDSVKKLVPELWEKYSPLPCSQLRRFIIPDRVTSSCNVMIHVGVSGIASEITLEMQAHRSGYCMLDTKGTVPPCGTCCQEGEDCIIAAFDVPRISVNVTQKSGLPICVSNNAGRYLCEYVYYTSLKMDRNRSLFIHVPEIGKPYTAQELAKGIKCVISEMLQFLRQQCIAK